jgi:hypothetical protein
MTLSVCGTWDSHHPPPHLDFYVKAKCAGSGSPYECVPSPKSIKVCSWCTPTFSSIIWPVLFLISTCNG